MNVRPTVWASARAYRVWPLLAVAWLFGHNLAFAHPFMCRQAMEPSL